MKIRFWGTRGSIPVSMTGSDVRSKLRFALLDAASRAPLTALTVDGYLDTLSFDVAGTFGGHTSCLQIVTDGPEHIILDLGTGVRPLGQAMLARFGPALPQTYHVFMSHLHWDHIMGFPFFSPAYIAGNRIVIHACHAQVEHAFLRQQCSPSFPVDFGQLAATIEFDVLAPDTPYQIAGFEVSARRQRHAGDSYGWRFEQGGRSLVYSTDSEHRLDNAAELAGVVAFFASADAVVFDAMFSLADAISVKADWGHSSNIVGVELCQAAGAKRLVLFHHEPAYSDAQILGVLNETRRFEEITRDGHALEVLSAWDGQELVL
ncbi:MAG: MBL fold metallo-hydrolase [Rhodoferax sp.]|nr:MBL fold metallo-hydrolase [Rhodoferax sp.]